MVGFLILAVFGEEFIAVLIKRLLVVVDEKENTGCKEVGGRCLEELVGTATGSLLSLLKGLNKCLRCFLCCSQICNVLLLDRIDACAVLNIDKVNDIEVTAFWQVTLHLIFPIMIIELGCKRRELVVIDNHCKTLGRMLTDIRLYDRECLSGTGRAHNPCASEGIDNIDPTPPELALVVVAHRDIDGILVLDKLCCLLETFVFKVEPVFEHAILEIFRYIVKSSMDKYCPYDRHGHINPHIGFQDP